MHRKGRIVQRLAASMLVVEGLAACGESTQAPDPADSGVAEQGAALYQANCAQCHGADLRGTDQGPPHLDVIYEPGHHGDAAFVLAVRRGVQPHHWDYGAMPAIEGLSDQDIADIIAYVREQQRRVGIE